MLIETRYKHIVLDQAQVPTIAGTTMKVIEVVLAHLAYGWSPDELYFQFPHLTLDWSQLINLDIPLGNRRS